MKKYSNAKIRLDKAIQEMHPKLTRNHIIHLIKAGHVLVNDIPVTKAGFIVRANDKIEITIPKPTTLSLKPLKADLNIIHETKNYLVINKPPFLPVHPSHGHPDDTLVNILAHHYPEFKDFGAINNTLRPGIVHRLDMNTSGLIVVAKNQPTLNKFQTDIKDKKWEKIYLAWVLNNSGRSRGVISENIARHPKHRHKFAITSTDNGKTAITHYEVIENFEIDKNTISLVKIKLETGRTHQIRVHLLSENMPILGDELYNHKESKIISKSLDLKRQLLHAYKLTILDPITNEEKHFEAPAPPDFDIKK